MFQKNKKKIPPIAYISQSFPGLTTTFIYREVTALRRLGFHIKTFAIWKPPPKDLSAESHVFLNSTYYVFPVSWSQFIARHLYFLIRSPAKYFGTAFLVLSRKGESWHNRLRTLCHFAEAIYLAKDMQKHGIKHIHAHFSINAATIALVASRLLDITFSFTAHNILFIDRLILKEKVREARFIISISRFTSKFLVNLFPQEDFADKVHIVHCGLSPQDFTPESRDSSHPPMVLFLAQLAERKGAPVLVEACHILKQQGVPFCCYLVGEGPQRSEIEQLIRQYGLQGNVTLTGAVFQENIKDYLNRADIFVLPCITAANGDMDGIPVSLMEAMAMEIATVSTFVSGIPELIDHGENGLLVQEKDPVSLAESLKLLINDEQLRTRLATQGRQKVLDEFDIKKTVAQLATLFTRYLSNDENK